MKDPLFVRDVDGDGVLGISNRELKVYMIALARKHHGREEAASQIEN